MTIEVPILKSNFSDNYLGFKKQIADLAERPFEETNKPNLSPKDALDLVLTCIHAYNFHRRFRRMVQSDQTLPKIIRKDPPSLRSTMWMILVDQAIEPDGNISIEEKFRNYPLRFYALMRCYLNAMDDIMDANFPLITKKDLLKNENFAVITKALALEFLNLLNVKRYPRESIKRTLRHFRLIRDLWLEHYNNTELDREKLDFNSAIFYTINTMGPLTAVLNHTLTVNRIVSPQKEQNLNEALVWYGTAGKIMDDMTDWLKDWSRGEMNIFTLALKESGELDRVKFLSKVKALGQKAFVPILIFHLFAPKATQRTLDIVDFYIGKLESCGFPNLTSSLKGVRQMLWAYALNEGVPQV